MFIKNKFFKTIISDFLTLIILIRTFECKLWEPLTYKDEIYVFVLIMKKIRSDLQWFYNSLCDHIIDVFLKH